MDRHGGNTFGRKIEYDFSVNLSPLGLPERVKTALKNLIDDKELENYPDYRQRNLRSSIAKVFGVNPEMVSCGNGAADLIYRIPIAIKQELMAAGKGEEGPKALILAPTFSEYSKALKEGGFNRFYHVVEERDGFLPGEDFLNKVQNGGYQIVWICNPGNPTGALMSKEYIERLVNICETNDSYLVLDECFMELTEEGDKNSLINEINNHPGLIVIRSFTKTYAMAGLRLGYVICGDPGLAEAIREIGQPWDISKPAEVAGISALEDEEYIGNVRAFLREEGLKLYKSLIDMGLKAVKPSGNYIMFSGPKTLDEILINKGVLIRNCSNYIGLEEDNYSSEGSKEGHKAGWNWYRVAVKLPEENRILLEALKEAMDLNRG